MILLTPTIATRIPQSLPESKEEIQVPVTLHPGMNRLLVKSDVDYSPIRFQNPFLGTDAVAAE